MHKLLAGVDTATESFMEDVLASVTPRLARHSGEIEPGLEVKHGDFTLRYSPDTEVAEDMSKESPDVG